MPSHAGPPEHMAWQIGVSHVSEDFAVDLQIGAGAAFLALQRMLAERWYSGSRYLSHSGGGSTTWLSLSNTTKSLVVIRSALRLMTLGIC